MSTISRSPTPPPRPPPRPPNSIEPINPPRARPARPPMRPPPNMPGRCCWGADGVGDVTRDGLEGVDGVAGDEYEREPRLPPLPARANTAAVSRNSSDISVSTAMSRSALGFMGTSAPILARSRNQHHLTGCLARLERPVRFGRVLQWELELRAHFELAVTDPAQQLVGALEQLGARDDVVVEARPRQEERAPGVEDLRIE